MVKATSSGNFKAVKLPEPSTTVARCYSLIDIGTVPNIYQGQLQGHVHRIFLTWELPKFKAVFNEEKGEQPFVVSEEFTLSTKENSNLSKLVSAWRGVPLSAAEMKEFDPAVMVGKSCLIQFMHKRKKAYQGQEVAEVTNENTNLKMQAIMKRPKDMEMPDQINPTYIWDWEKIEKGEEQFDHEKFELIPNFLKTKIMESQEFKKYATPIEGEATQAGSEDSGGQVTAEDW